MSRPFIVLGDRTDHGGTVIQASVMSDTPGKGIARVGDQVTCPIPGHGTTVIVTGDPTMIIDGKPVARHGDKCACGATLISGQVVSRIGNGGSSNSQAANSTPKSSATSANPSTNDSGGDSNPDFQEDELEYYFVAERHDGKPVPLAYRIDADGMKLHEGQLGQDGKTLALPMSKAGEPTFWIPAPASWPLLLTVKPLRPMSLTKLPPSPGLLQTEPGPGGTRPLIRCWHRIRTTPMRLKTETLALVD